MSYEPDDLQDEEWVEALAEQIGEERLLKAMGRRLTKHAQIMTQNEGEDMVSDLLFHAAAACEEAAMDIYVSNK